MAPIPRKVTSRTHDYANRTKPRNPVRNHVIEIDLWRYSKKRINMGVSTQLIHLISWAYQSQHLNQKWRYLSGIGWIKEYIVGELVGSGKFVNQNILVAGY